jgi:hypothetical protein
MTLFHAIIVHLANMISLGQQCCFVTRNLNMAMESRILVGRVLYDTRGEIA